MVRTGKRLIGLHARRVGYRLNAMAHNAHGAANDATVSTGQSKLDRRAMRK